MYSRNRKNQPDYDWCRSAEKKTLKEFDKTQYCIPTGYDTNPSTPLRTGLSFTQAKRANHDTA